MGMETSVVAACSDHNVRHNQCNIYPIGHTDSRAEHAAYEHEAITVRQSSKVQHHYN